MGMRYISMQQTPFFSMHDFRYARFQAGITDIVCAPSLWTVLVSWYPQGCHGEMMFTESWSSINALASNM